MVFMAISFFAGRHRTAGAVSGGLTGSDRQLFPAVEAAGFRRRREHFRAGSRRTMPPCMPHAPDTEQLVRRAQAGDVRAFEALIAAHIAPVRRFARAFTHNEADADDLAQEALVKVYRAVGGYRFQSAFSTWLYAVVRNAFLDLQKSRAGRERAAEQPLRRQDAGGEREGPAPPDEQLAAEQDRRRLWQAVGQVPTEYRTALVLFDVEGLSYEEIAEVERVALGTVKSRIARGRDRLRRLLREDLAAGGNQGPLALVTHAEKSE
jgi:RNA polymerase sigma-70 factor (ECF subfamily)